MWAQRPIVEKHNRYALYHSWTEGMASILCDIPAKFGTSVMFHVTLYFMTKLRRTASAFFTYFAFMFFIVLAMSMVFRTLGSLSRTMEQTMAPASIIVLLCIVYTGFVIPVPYMKPWLSWFRRLNPMAYAYESLMINEVCNIQTLSTAVTYLLLHLVRRSTVPMFDGNTWRIRIDEPTRHEWPDLFSCRR